MGELITQSGPLAIPLEHVKTQIAECKDLSWLKDMSDKLAAFAAYSKTADVSLEIQNDVAETRLYCFRQMGALLKEMPKHAGGRPSENTLHDERCFRELGINYTQSSRWQSIAKLSDDEFSNYVESCRESEKEITASGALKLAKALYPPKSDPVKYEEKTGVCYDLLELDGKKFGCIYADPPWKYGNQGTRASTDNHYPTMTVEEICQMPVKDLAADDSHLHLWTTSGFLPDAFKVIEEWGFEYRSSFVWVKPQMGMGNSWRISHELLLFASRGNAKRFSELNHKSWMELPRRKHSQKPREIRDIIERVSPGPRLELFGRDKLEGWTVFGNQINLEVLL